MKKQVLMYGCLLATVLFIGCSTLQKDRNIKDIFSKNSINIENILEISKQYNQTLSENYKLLLKQHYGYEGKITDEALSQTYRLSFYFTLDKSNYHDITDRDNYRPFFRMVIQPCEIQANYDDYKNYPLYGTAHIIKYKTNNGKEVGTYGVYFKIEDLRQLSYISDDENEQKDLCLFEKEKSEDMAYKYTYTSNDIVYTAEEINTIMDEYEALR